jgi:hypothetical protein
MPWWIHPKATCVTRTWTSTLLAIACILLLKESPYLFRVMRDRPHRTAQGSCPVSRCPGGIYIPRRTQLVSLPSTLCRTLVPLPDAFAGLCAPLRHPAAEPLHHQPQDPPTPPRTRTLRHPAAERPMPARMLRQSTSPLRRSSRSQAPRRSSRRSLMTNTMRESSFTGRSFRSGPPSGRGDYWGRPGVGTWRV